MVKKTDNSEFVNSMRESAQQIWLAGLGAFAKAQAEGSKMFENLVNEGATIQRKSQTTADEKLNDVGARMSDMSAKAGQQWNKLESIFEDRTARALSRLGVPNEKQVKALEARIDALATQVAKLEKMVKPLRPAAKRMAARSATTGSKPSQRKRGV